MDAIYWISTYLLEFIKLNIFVFGIFKCQSKGKKLQWVPSVIAIVIIGAVTLLLGDDNIIIPLSSVFLMISMFIALKRKKDFFLVLLAFFLESCIEGILEGTMGMLLPQEVFIMLGDNTTAFLFDSFMGICLLMLERILHKKKEVFNYSVKSVTLVFMGVLGMAIYLYPIQYNYRLLKNNKHDFVYSLVGVSISSIIFFFICFINLTSINQRETYKKRAESYEKYVKKQELYYKELLEKEKSTRQFRHDIINHLACLRMYLETGKVKQAEKYIDEMLGTTRTLSGKIVTGNDTIDIVAADVFRGEQEVTLNWSGRFPNYTSISDMDLCILFSNLLRNALEASRLSEGSSKEVTVQIKEYEPTYFIFIKNPCKENPEKKGHRYITWKKDKNNHGFGMLNIEQVIKKYNGTTKYKYNNLTFYTEICLEDILEKNKTA